MATKTVKLFVDAHVFDQEFQGAQTFLRELYGGLLQHHAELQIYMGARDVNNIRELFPALPLANILPYKKNRPGIMRYVLDIPRYIRKYRFDFAHFQYISPRIIAGCSYIVTLHDVLFNDFQKEFSFPFRISRQLLFGRSIQQARIKTTVSDYSRRRICHHYHIPANDIHVIPNGVSNTFNQFHASAGEAADAIYNKFGIKNFLLYASRVEPRKNQLLLLQKYLKLGLYKQGISLVFIGKASIQIPALNRLIKSLDEEQRRSFYWLEQVTPEDLSAFYRACRLFVYPSKAEGFGIPPLEAAICHAPVLCSCTTAMQDFDFFSPYTFDPDNEEEFENKLAWTLHYPPGDKFLSEVARHVEAHYNWQQSSQSFFSLLQANN